MVAITPQLCIAQLQSNHTHDQNNLFATRKIEFSIIKLSAKSIFYFMVLAHHLHIQIPAPLLLDVTQP